MKMTDTNYEDLPLGKSSSYNEAYNPDLLAPVSRQAKRDEIGVGQPLPFKGWDIWNAYEISWLNPKGKPTAAIAEFIVPCESSHIVESKSFKLYLNSFNQTRFASVDEVKQRMTDDLSARIGMPVVVNIHFANDCDDILVAKIPGDCIDDIDIECNTYQVNPNYLTFDSKQQAEETLVSHLLKSNCLVTNQPDWGSVQIQYCGNKMDHAGLLKYIVSMRLHNEFHEQCVERIFMDILRQCQPNKLTVYARYTRRGGLDINPIRSTEGIELPSNARMFRQ